MSLIQLLLIFGAAASLGVYLRYFRTVLRDRGIAMALFVTAVVFILFPDLTTVVANGLGVGRGTDLLIYLLAIGTVFAFVMLATKVMSMERTITELVRQSAIANAERPRDDE